MVVVVMTIVELLRIVHTDSQKDYLIETRTHDKKQQDNNITKRKEHSDRTRPTKKETHQVWAAGRRWLPPNALWMLNFWIPRIPCRVANPPSGTCNNNTHVHVETTLRKGVAHVPHVCLSSTIFLYIHIKMHANTDKHI